MAGIMSPLVYLLTSLLTLVQGYAITGLSGGVNYATGERPFRTEINDFATSGAAFDLYILSLQKMQQANESDLTSWFQIAGIHGYPTVEWDNAPGNADWGWGYCYHDSVLFPTWHRPYVFLFEQVLWEAAQSIAATYPDDQKDEYVQAAVTFRIPYWDWAINPAIPSVASSAKITVNTPTGSQSIDNPLFNYTFQAQPIGNGFPTSDASGTPAFSTYMSTLRWPDSNNQSQNGAATYVLQQNAAFLLSTVYQILSSSPNYTEISTSAVSQTSIEYVHDAVHYFVGGGGGHMDYLQWAGFDPMFWLHHANVDRIFGIWQAIYPDSYVESFANPSNFALEPGTTVNGNSALSPFSYNEENAFYSPTTIRWDAWFGYAYPEVLDWTMNATSLSADVRTKVNKLYNPNAGSSSSKKAKRLVAPNVPRFRDRSVLSNFKHVDITQYHELDVNNLDQQWVANVEVDKFSINSSLNIDLFLGSPPSDKADWGTAQNLLGTFAVLSSAGAPPAAHGANGVTKHGQIPLTANLAAAVSQGIIHDIEPSSVKPLLKAALEVKVRATNGAELGDLNGFAISIASRNVTAAASISEFPTYGAWIEYPELTEHLNN